MEEKKDIDDILLKVTDSVVVSYWKKLIEETDSFPDIEGGYDAKMLIVEFSLYRILCEYLMTMDKSSRKKVLEELIKDFRKIPSQLAD